MIEVGLLPMVTFQAHVFKLLFFPPAFVSGSTGATQANETAAAGAEQPSEGSGQSAHAM